MKFSRGFIFLGVFVFCANSLFSASDLQFTKLSEIDLSQPVRGKALDIRLVNGLVKYNAFEKWVSDQTSPATLCRILKVCLANNKVTEFNTVLSHPLFDNFPFYDDLFVQTVKKESIPMTETVIQKYKDKLDSGVVSDMFGWCFENDKTEMGELIEGHFQEQLAKELEQSVLNLFRGNKEVEKEEENK